MNQGKRYLRNTVLAALVGSTLLVLLATRIYISAVDEETPKWLRSLIALGLQVKHAPPPAKTVSLAEAGSLRFTSVSVDGDFAVELVSAPAHNVSLVSAEGHAWNGAAAGSPDGLLSIKGSGTGHGAVLRIEAPALDSIEVQNLPRLTIRNWQAPELTIHTRSVQDLRLEESAVKHWFLDAGTLLKIHADKATTSSGYEMRVNGHVHVHDADGKKVMELHGKGGDLKRMSGAGMTISYKTTR